MALLMAWVDPDNIRLMGRWCSDTMLCYLHTMINIFKGGLIVCMFQYGYYMLIMHAHSDV